MFFYLELIKVPVRHLVFTVQGIGQRLQKANLVDDVGIFRHLTAILAEQHLTTHQRRTQRVLFIPCQVVIIFLVIQRWHNGLVHLFGLKHLLCFLLVQMGWVELSGRKIWYGSTIMTHLLWDLVQYIPFSKFLPKRPSI